MYRNTPGFLFTMLFLITCLSAMAQPKIVTGKITDQATGRPIEGVSINVKGAATTVITNTEGDFSISVPSDQSVWFVNMDPRYALSE